jgi:cell division protein FtsN
VSEHDEHPEEHELYEEVPPRSIFAATWFRVLLVVIVVGVIGAVAVPYVLDFMNPPPSRPTTSAKAPAPIPATPSPEKKDTPLFPAPAPAPPPTAAAPVEPKTAAVPPERGKSAMSVTQSAPSKAPAAAPKADAPAKPDTTAKTDATAKADTAVKSDAPAKSEVVAKADSAKPAAKDTAKPAVAAKPVSEPKRAAATASTTTSRPATTATGPFWVQVGAFKDPETAKKVASKLREDNFTVEESVTRSGGAPAAKSAPRPAAPAPAPTAKPPDITSDQYDVFVSGQTPEELNKRLAAKGLAAEASGNGMVVKPSLPLRDAVALSKDLAVEGFKVQVRRAGGSMASASPAPSAPAAAATPAPSSDGATELHRVRVGAFADRAAAQEAIKQLEAKGYKPFIARGDR